mgnify:FL=1
MTLAARLLAIVSVPPARRVQCQNPGCGHGVYAAIHVVEDGGQLVVMGSTCFAKRFGSGHALGKPSYSAGGINGGMLSEEERQMLMDNTAALMAMFKDRHETALSAAADKLKALRLRFAQNAANQRPTQSPPAPRPPTFNHRPWAWQHQRNTSVALFSSACGQNWLRVQHQDGTHKLVPWPMFDGWDEALPPSCGVPDRDLQAYSPSDLPKAFATLNQLGHIGPIVGVWPAVLQAANSHPGQARS